MTETSHEHKARAGDTIAVDGHRVGETRRLGVILEVMGETGHEHFRVRWEDDRESVVYPGSDAIVRPGSESGARRGGDDDDR